jgi:hypothetical protein
MNFAETKLVVDTIDNPATDCRDLLKRLIDWDHLSLEAVLAVIGSGAVGNCNKVINGVSISPANYNNYVEFNKVGQAIQSIKQIRMDYNLGLKEAKDINDIIKEHIGIIRVEGVTLNRDQSVYQHDR